MSQKSANLRVLPSVQQVFNAVASDLDIKESFLVSLIREELTACRQALQSGELVWEDKITARDAVCARVRARVQRWQDSTIIKVVNATGVVLHTGLGRAPFGREIMQQVADLLDGYINLEYDLESGERGERLDLDAPLLCLLSGAPAAAIVNNNAAAVLLTLNTLAEGKAVIVSRGELIEIGGSFRLPEVIAKSGARLIEVGTTNRTHLKDYQEAITADTAAILVAHPSNYRITGFTTKPQSSELIHLAHQHKIPIIMDLGSGVLFDPQTVGLPAEPVVSQAVAAGFDIITFSGDKLLGGPQAGIIIGKENLIKRIRKNPLMRALRCDKLTLTLLNFTLRRYIAKREVPPLTTYQFLLAKPEELAERATRIMQSLPPQVVEGLNITIQATYTEVGSGSMPTEKIPSVALVLAPPVPETTIAWWLRINIPPIIGYRRKGKYYLDLKAVAPEEDEFIRIALERLYQKLSDKP